MRFEWEDGKPIPNQKTVRYKLMNHLLEVKSIKTVTNGLESILKLNKDQYMIKDTGEIKEYIHTENRAQNVSGLKDSFRKIRELINNNFTGDKSELHVTLTYSENMTDTKKLYKDYEKFWKRVKYRYPMLEYLTIIEPQGRGAWHHHLLLKNSTGEKLYIPSKNMSEMWGNGFVKIKSLDGIDNIGAYLSAYLGDIEIKDEMPIEVITEISNGHKFEIKEVDVEGVSKKFLKGARCYLYPSGMNLYRKSKGIKPPEEKKVKYIEIKKIVGSATPNYFKTLTISEDDRELNQITYEYYNLKRKDGQFNTNLNQNKNSLE